MGRARDQTACLICRRPVPRRQAVCSSSVRPKILAPDNIDATIVSACSHGCVRLVCRRPPRGVGELMDRRAKPKKGKAEAKPPRAHKTLKDGAKIRDLEKRLAEALKDKT